MEKVIKISGPFRSGTNLMKYLLQENYQCSPLFDVGWWKHSLPPCIIINQQEHWLPNFLSIVMVRDPQKFCSSLFTFYQATRPNLIKGKNFSNFIRSEIIVHDIQHKASGPKYWYRSPVDYWNSFYHAWLEWENMNQRTVFVNIDSLIQETELILQNLEKKIFINKLATSSEIKFPKNPIAPSNDVMPAGETQTQKKKNKIFISTEDKKLINDTINSEILERLDNKCADLSEKNE